jgi:hypothetical protein
MKNQIILLGMVILLICIELSGCNEINNSIPSEEDRFVGTWKHETGINDEIITFFSNGTGLLAGDPTTWEIKDGNVVIYLFEGEMTLTYDYSFSDDDNELTLTPVGVRGGISIVFIRQ